MPKANSLNMINTGLQAFDGTSTFNGRTLTAGTNISVTNGNGASGNPTVEDTSIAAGALAVLDEFDDLLGEQNNPGRLNWQESVASGDVFYNTSSESGRPGIITVSTLTSSTGSGRFFLGSATGTLPIILGGGELTVEFWVKIPTLSTGTQRYTVLIGLSAGWTSLTSDGCYFKYVDNVNSGAWTITCDAAATTSANTSNTVDTSWHRYKIVVNAGATSVAFYIDGTQVTGSPLAANIPTTDLGAGIMITKSVGAEERTALFDLFTIRQVLTSSR